ncbi:cellulose binding domain-containing protein [Kitasatospora sp. NPDC097691]|uniref:cellulose binding domain-containing protein n=1 Tax=Kitasatospora sp. NPDC097691 TaxID=3157231 RepID=UPI00332F8867
MTSPRQSCHERVIAAAAALPLAVTGVIAAVAPPAAAASTVSVSVDAALQLATVPDTGIGIGIGINTAVFDPAMNDSATPGLLRDAGIGAVRYPGGSHSDVYHWQTGTASGGAYVAPDTGFDAFMGTVHAAGAQPIITVNYGSGTPQEAADWVRYANLTKGFGIKYWEVGNEVYGNGEYSNGTGWEYDTHSSKSAMTYATNPVQYVDAMKAVDPGIKVGAVLTTPGGWPEGVVGPGDTMDWNHTVLSIAGSKVDFVIVHTSCRVVYNKNEWPGGVIGTVTVVNNGLGQVNGWDLGFNFAGDNAITSSWNATVKQSGPGINAGNVSYNAAVPQGGSVQWGFKATWSGSDANPSAFWFNGASCAIG